MLPEPVVGRPREWEPERSFSTGGSAEQAVRLSEGRWQLSLQHHSAVPIRVQAVGLDEELPASLDGMYGFEPGEGQFWPAGSITVKSPTAVRITVRQGDRTWLERLLGVERRTWLGTLALTPGTRATEVALADACGLYVDRYRAQQ